MSLQSKKSDAIKEVGKLYAGKSADYLKDSFIDTIVYSNTEKEINQVLEDARRRVPVNGVGSYKDSDVLTTTDRNSYLHGLARGWMDGVNDVDNRYDEFHDDLVHAVTHGDCWNVKNKINDYIKDLQRRGKM